VAVEALVVHHLVEEVWEVMVQVHLRVVLVVVQSVDMEVE